MSNPTEHDVVAALQSVRQQIIDMANRHGRDPADIQLLAVSKTKPIAAIEAAWSAGQHAFGENYPDEAVDKIMSLQDKAIDWHFIGAIQSRKAAALATHFSWVHGVDRLKVAKKLSDSRPADADPLNICIQVNIDKEASKSGVSPSETLALADECAELPGLRLRGLMAIPAPSTDTVVQRDAFSRLRNLFEQVKSTHTDLDTLSMGMSGDLDSAIAEGATIVRVGTAIFGARDTRA